MHNNFNYIILSNKNWNENIDSPIYLRLYNTLKSSIINGDIEHNLKLPPSRVLAKDLEISRSTVLKCYDLLLIEKYIKSRSGSGYYVDYRKVNYSRSKIIDSKNKYPNISKTAKRFLKNRYINTDNFTKLNIAFRPGLPPLDIFPVAKWKSIVNNYWQNSNPTQLSYAPSDGIESFKTEIASYLRIYRGLKCDHKQIIIVSGSLHSLSLVTNTILNYGDQVVIENPVFPRAHMLFKSMKAEIIPCGVDANGMNISQIQDQKPKLIYTTPSNQYPSGVRMSIERRKELLHIASKKGALIIEDDYDHEFSNWENPLPSIFNLDTENRVIYLGTFNKLMHPSLRLGYMVVPEFLIEPIKALYEQTSRFISSDKQEVMREFIKSDYLNQHLRNVLKIAKKRKELFKELTKSSFEFNKKNLGLHIVAYPKKKRKDTDIYKDLLKNNVVAYPLSNYYINKQGDNGLVLGYSSVNEKIMHEKAKILNSVLG